MKKADIILEDLRIGYSLKKNRKKIISDDIHQSLYKGELTCLLGSNGAGKSTLLRTLVGFLPPLHGKVCLRGKPLNSYREDEIARNIGIVLTDKTYEGGLTVFELVSLGRYPYTDFFGNLSGEDCKIIYESLEKTGISHKSDAYLAELSDGERQKAIIAKALAQQCPVIILDEPTAFLDAGSRFEIMLLLKELAQKEDKTVLLSTHDIETAIRLADRIWLLEKGKAFVAGVPEDLILQDIFGEYVGKGNFYFDKQSGSFKTLGKRGEPVFITGDSTMCFWLENALRKYHKEVIKGVGYPHITCENPAHFLYQQKESDFPQAFATIEELLPVIRN